MAAIASAATVAAGVHDADAIPSGSCASQAHTCAAAVRGPCWTQRPGWAASGPPPPPAGTADARARHGATHKDGAQRDLLAGPSYCPRAVCASCQQSQSGVRVLGHETAITNQGSLLLRAGRERGTAGAERAHLPQRQELAGLGADELEALAHRGGGGATLSHRHP